MKHNRNIIIYSDICCNAKDIAQFISEEYGLHYFAFCQEFKNRTGMTEFEAVKSLNQKDYIKLCDEVIDHLKEDIPGPSVILVIGSCIPESDFSPLGFVYKLETAPRNLKERCDDIFMESVDHLCPSKSGHLAA